MTEAARFGLFSFWRTSTTYRARVAFNLRGVPPQEHNIDIDVGEQRSEVFLRINSMGAIPALLDHADGPSSLPLAQSLAILELIGETYPTSALLPEGTHARTRAFAGRHAGR